MKNSILCFAFVVLLSVSSFAQTNTNRSTDNSCSLEFVFTGKIENQADSVFKINLVVDESVYKSVSKIKYNINNSSKEISIETFSESEKVKTISGKQYIEIGETSAGKQIMNIEILNNKGEALSIK